MSHRATAQIILDSISTEGHRLTTFQLRYWRPIHSELMTHRVFSRNAGSSRARPSGKIIEQVREAPWGPIHWGANQPGMQAGAELTGEKLTYAQLAWFTAAGGAANMAEAMLREGAHKQIVNRLLEPFTYIDVLVTATDYANWFTLRDHPDAQPEIQDLARKMRAAMDASTPKLLKPGEWHLPYTSEEDWENAERHLLDELGVYNPTKNQLLVLVRKISVARCARESYKAFDGTVAPIGKDLKLYHKLVVSEPLHASPAEHQATPDTLNSYDKYTMTDEGRDIDSGVEYANPHLHGNFTGWIQYRKTLPNEFVEG